MFLLAYFLTLKMYAVHSSETTVNLYWTTDRRWYSYLIVPIFKGSRDKPMLLAGNTDYYKASLWTVPPSFWG
jgi:hypothetical protein